MKSKQEKCHYLVNLSSNRWWISHSLNSSRIQLKKKQEIKLGNTCSRTILSTASDSKHGHRSELDSLTRILPPEQASPSDGGVLYKTGNPVSIPYSCIFAASSAMTWEDAAIVGLGLDLSLDILNSMLGKMPIRLSNQPLAIFKG